VALGSALRGVLPQPVWDLVAGRLFGVYRSMDTFTGRPPSTPPIAGTPAEISAAGISAAGISAAGASAAAEASR
jgi:hypothetical protein